MQRLKNLEKIYSQAFISSVKYDSRAVYARRRLNLLKKLDSFCVFAGMPVEPGCEEVFVQTWTRFVQEPAFLYLTGLNEAGCYLVLDPRNGRQTLFLPRKDPFKEFWFGRRLGYLEGDRDAEMLTGFADVRPADDIWKYVQELAREYSSGKAPVKHAYAYYFEKFKGDHNSRLESTMRTKVRPCGMEVRSCADLHFAARLVLESGRIGEAEVAQRITDEAFREILPQVSSMKNERELCLALNYCMQKRSDGDLAFPTICAGGENACCLHYVKNDEQINKKGLVLLDFGVRFGTLHSDISRTIPASGRFNPLQAMLYQIVLDAGKFYQKFVKPGVSLKEIGQKPWEFIMEQLEKRLVKGAKGSFRLLYDKRPHGVSHFIGEQIHEGDPGSRSLDVVLEPGMLISCEPGLYGEFSAVIEGRRYREKIGIRIEDDLLITDNGFINISKKIPREIKEIESLM